MYKLKDIIASRGRNPKINKALDRYELSKHEKKDIINTIKNTVQNGEDTPGTGDGGSTWRYFDIRKDTSAFYKGLQEVAMMIKAYNKLNGVVIVPAGVSGILQDSVEVYAFGCDTSKKMFTQGIEIEMGVSLEQVLQLVPGEIIEITEEEFYNLGD